MMIDRIKLKNEKLYFILFKVIMGKKNIFAYHLG